MEPNAYVAWVFATLTWFAVNGYNAKYPHDHLIPERVETKPDVVPRTQTGNASIYWQPQQLSCGGTLSYKSEHQLWAAHPSLPCWSRVKVTSLHSCCQQRYVYVRIVDRGPNGHNNRVIDLFPGAAAKIGLTKKMGVMPVRLEWIATDQAAPAKERRKKRTRRTKRR